ncbi:MAG: glucose/galactose MFS transporter, partial [Sphingobacteriales bacterium]
SWILEKTGFKKGMMLGLIVMAIGAILFIPAAQTRIYGLFLSGLFIIGTGLALLQTAVNPYVTIVGPIESAARRISIMGICNKVAGVLAPLVLGAIILSDADTLTTNLTTATADAKQTLQDELAGRIILPYILMTIILIGLALMIWFSSLPEIETEEETQDLQIAANNKTSIFQFPNLVLGVISLFLYVGVEVMAGDTIGLFGQSQDIPLSIAKYFPSFTLTAMIIGYIIGILTIPKFMSQTKALAISAVVGVIFSLLAIYSRIFGVDFYMNLNIVDLNDLLKFKLTFESLNIHVDDGFIAVMFIALLGLTNALMWPAIWPLAIHGLGKFTKQGSALLIMAIAGGAVLPLVYGRLADMENIGYQQAYWIMIPCYLFILFYAMRGQKSKV